MAFADTRYTARLGLDTIERGRNNVIKCPVRRSGALVAPSSGTVTVYDPNGTAQVDAQSVTIAASTASYTITSAFATDPLGDGWAIEWALAMPDSTTHTFRTDAALVRRQLYPVVADADLIRRVPALDPNGSAPITSAANYQDRLDEAWDMILRRLHAQGVLPWLVVNAEAFREAHLTLALHLIYRDLATRSGGAGYYAGEAEAYRGEWEQAFRNVRLRVDYDEDGAIDDATERVAARPAVWLGRGARWLR